MPDTPIKPPNKRVDELTTEITLNVHDKFEHIMNRRERDTKMIDYLGKELAFALAKLEMYEDKE